MTLTARPRTSLRNTVEVIFGILVPIVCFVFDPSFLSVGLLGCGRPTLGSTTAYFVYPAVAIGILAFSFWLSAGEKFPKLGAFLAGIFWTGSVLALWLSFPLFICGLLAWIAAFVYGRNGLDAWKLAAPTKPLLMRMLHVLAGALFVLALAWLVYYFLPPWFPPAAPPPCSDQ